MTSASSTSTAARPQETITGLSEALQTTLQGPSADSGWRLPPQTEQAFTPDAAVTPLSAPGGLWSWYAKPLSGSCQMLCLRTPSGEPAVANVGAPLPDDAHRSAYFLREGPHRRGAGRADCPPAALRPRLAGVS